MLGSPFGLRALLRGALAVVLPLAALAVLAGRIPGARAGAFAPGPLRPVAVATAPDARFARLEADPGLGVVMCWFEELERGGFALRFAHGVGRECSAPTTIAAGDSFFVNWADFPALCSLGNGTLAAVWPWKTGADEYAYELRIAFTRDRGETWSAPLRLHDDARGTEHGFVSLVREDATHVRAVWLDGHNLLPGAEEGSAEMTLHSRVAGADGSLGEESELDARTCDCCQTALVKTGDGLLAAYRDRDPKEIRDIALARFEAGRWTAGPGARADRWTMPGCPVNGPALVARGQRVALVWYTEADETPSVWIAFSDDRGRRFGEPVRVDEGAPLGRLDAEMLDDGSALVTWLEGEKAVARVLARRVTPRGEQGATFEIGAASGARGSGVPQVARDGRTLVFAWTEPGPPHALHLAASDLGR